MVDATVALVVLGGFFVAIWRLGEIRDELRYQSQLLNRAIGKQSSSPPVAGSRSPDSDMPSLPKLARGIRLDDPADDK